MEEEEPAGEEEDEDDERVALGQITRCANCTTAYARSDDPSQCASDRAADRGLPVPCCTTPRARFDLMGLTMRTPSWRYTAWCAWDGARLRPRLDSCAAVELFDHRLDAAPYDVDGEAEHVNRAGEPALREVEAALRRQWTERWEAAYEATTNPPREPYDTWIQV